MNGRRLVVLFAIAAGFIVYGYVKDSGDMPPPSVFVGTATIYTFAAIVAEFAAPLGTALAFGWTLQLAYTYVLTRGKTQGAAAAIASGTVEKGLGQAAQKLGRSKVESKKGKVK